MLIENHQNFIKNPEKLLYLACYDSKDLKFFKPEEIYDLR